MTGDRATLRTAVIRAAFAVLLAVGASLALVRAGWIHSVAWIRVSLAFPIAVVVLYLSARRRG
jgi:hypothetical protein